MQMVELVTAMLVILGDSVLVQHNIVSLGKRLPRL
jgi:hypothetical protein